MVSRGTILVVDDSEDSRALFDELLGRDGYAVRLAPDGAAALEMVSREAPDLVLSDVVMPNVNGFELCRQLKRASATRLVPVVLVTGACDREDRITGIEAGADDFLTKPVDTRELSARVRSLVRLKRFTDDLDCAESVILRLGLMAEARAGYTSGHCERMAAYAAAFGVHLELSNDEIAALHRGGYLHDVGKIAVPDSVLGKADRLTAAEFDAVKRHTTIGDALCGDLRILRAVRPIVRHHHERLDGSGYPDGLRGDDVPLLAQITGIVDLYEALTTERPYHKERGEAAACAELEREAGRGWRRADLVAEFVALCRSGRLRKLSQQAGAAGSLLHVA
jgi:putative two-component system response regulator